MKKIVVLVVIVTCVLTACGQGAPTPIGEPTFVPNTTIPPTTVPATTVPATAIPANTLTVRAATPTLPSTRASVGATDTPAAPLDTPTAAPQLRPRATSAGPLTVAIYVANCRSVPTTAKPGAIVIQISVEAQGGNGVYTYFNNEGVQQKTKFIDIDWEKGTHLLGRVTVTSGDGQTVEKEYSISPSELKCP
jgi:hypothetical protein